MKNEQRRAAQFKQRRDCRVPAGGRRIPYRSQGRKRDRLAHAGADGGAIPCHKAKYQPAYSKYL